MGLNMKPGQLGYVVTWCALQPCSAYVQGSPVKVSHLKDIGGPVDLFEAIVDGPTWVLRQALPCPHRSPGCNGIARLPDASLRPFDPASDPEPREVPAEDHEGSQPDVKAPAARESA